VRPTQDPAKLQAWLANPAPHAANCVLFYAPAIVATWSLDQMRGPDAGEIVYAAARSHCEDMERSATFEVQWRDSVDRVLATKLIAADLPTDGDLLGGVEIGGAAGITQALALSLRHQHAQLKIIAGMLVPLIKGYQDHTNSLQHEVELLRTRVSGVLPLDPAKTGADAETERLKLEAMQKLVDLGPDIAQLGLAAIRKGFKLDGSEGGAATQ
jgi:hypothetical protein